MPRTPPSHTVSLLPLSGQLFPPSMFCPPLSFKDVIDRDNERTQSDSWITTISNSIDTRRPSHAQQRNRSRHEQRKESGMRFRNKPKMFLRIILLNAFMLMTKQTVEKMMMVSSYIPLALSAFVTLLMPCIVTTLVRKIWIGFQIEEWWRGWRNATNDYNNYNTGRSILRTDETCGIAQSSCNSNWT